MEDHAITRFALATLVVASLVPSPAHAAIQYPKDTVPLDAPGADPGLNDRLDDVLSRGSWAVAIHPGVDPGSIDRLGEPVLAVQHLVMLMNERFACQPGSNWDNCMGNEAYEYVQDEVTGCPPRACDPAPDRVTTVVDNGEELATEFHRKADRARQQCETVDCTRDQFPVIDNAIESVSNQRGWCTDAPVECARSVQDQATTASLPPSTVWL
jgi:hypothetical protein